MQSNAKKIDFYRFDGSEQELEHLLEKHLTIGSSTPENVKQFTREQQLSSSDLLNKTREIEGYELLVSSDLQYATFPFEQVIVAKTRAPKASFKTKFWLVFPFESVWKIYFTFSDKRLTEILVFRHYMAF